MSRPAALAMLLAVSLAGPAAGMEVPARCADRAALLAFLAERHGETPRARALDQGGLMIEILVSPSGSWTVLATAPGGPSCAVAAGEAWEDIPAAPTGPRV